MRRSIRFLPLAFFGSALLLSLQGAPRTGSSELDDAGVALPQPGTPGGPQTRLTGPALAQFLRGRERFDTPFKPSEGLGFPELNADSCRACHRDPVLGGAGPLELNVTRFANDNGGAGPFQNLPGGQAASKLVPPTLVREEIPSNADVYEQRQTPTLLGGGLIESIFEASILANEDPTDADADGVFGVARLVATGGPMPEVGRFGWKSQIPTITDFVKDAMGGECGITTPADGRGFAFTSDADAIADPELSQADVDDVAFFLQNLAAPARKGGFVGTGEMLFDAIGCTTCHVPALAGSAGPVPLYSDLLLHDVMPANFRGMSESGAGVGLYRTPPLWGIAETAPYMHDGRASSLRTAIESHFSEADNARLAFLALSGPDQEQVLRFLEDL